MRKPLFVSLTLGMLMVTSSVLTKVLTPIAIPADQQPVINLQAMIPEEFDDWKVDPYTAALVVNPDDRRLQDKIYNQTLSRTYLNKDGVRVMLSIAYDRDLSADMQVHRPEVCYAAGGFDIGEMTKTFAETSIGRIPVMHLVAKQGARVEPITYWIRVGDSLTRGWFEQKLSTIGYRLTRKVPDGLLFRISSISNNEQDSYKVQQAFLDSILQAVRSEDRFWLVGKLTQ